jgi:DNA polymerase-4
MQARTIIHVDMDAFYASVEQRDNPELKGKPVLVGGSGQRGVVAAASYESRVFGIHSAMPVREALRRCPDAICIRPRMAAYKEASTIVFGVFHEITPMVEGLSLDEAFLDVTASLSLFGSAEAIAARIRGLIRDRTGLAASVGVAANKLVAKIASDLAKPDGLFVVPPGDEADVLAPLPVERLPGVGRRTLPRLQRIGIHTFGDIQRLPVDKLQPVFGRYSERVRQRAAGIDTRPVVSDRAEKSVSAEETFNEDLTEWAEMEREMLHLSDRTSSRLRAKNLAAGVVQIKVREADFTTYTRQSQIRPAGNDTQRIYRVALGLLEQWRHEHPGRAIRLLGVGGAQLREATQMDLFAAEPGTEAGRVDQTMDEVRRRFGELGPNALRPARTLRRED